MKISQRLYNLRLLLLILLSVILVAIFIITIKFSTLKTFGAVFIKTFIISLTLIVIITITLYFLLRNKPKFKELINKIKTLYTIEKNLISMGCYIETQNKNIVITPKIVIDTINNKIIIKLDNPQIRNKLNQFDDVISTALPEDLISNKTYINRQQTEYIIEYINISDDNKLVYKDANEFIDTINNLPYSKFIIDKNHKLDINDGHVLITGGTGSGKSYFLRTLIISALIKKYDVSILDYKRASQVFNEVCIVASSIEQIQTTLDNTIEELHRRKELMDEILKTSPNALAHIEGKMSIKLLVIEEYIALVNSGADAKILKDIEKKILEILVIGRSLSIFVILVAQQSGTNFIPSIFRSNCYSRINLGTQNKALIETTFEIKSSVNTSMVFNKGEGLALLDGTNLCFIQVPTFEFNILDILNTLIKIPS